MLVIALAGYTAYYSQKTAPMSNWVKANREALASDENDGMSITCYDGHSSDREQGGAFLPQCSPCGLWIYLSNTSSSKCRNY